VLSRYTVRLEADARLYPILLANGDPVGEGTLDGGRHWAEWHDPFPKPCYLFALVAGDLVANRDSFVTRSGREVTLGIWVRDGDVPKTRHAMEALKSSMKWDEDAFGREYDLAVFNIVAVADFNFGAMENKGLNIFNSRYILAEAETATDADFDAVAGVVAHEYFHNWSGNRITCRDWFQLSLKEGFTVFRDQQYSADMGSAAVKRIEDVRVLRSGQFPEDQGPLAHPVRPESYIEISNFYTATIYNKGAELIRMIHTLAGPERFRAGTDVYFSRHDGEAATCEDFVSAMEDGAGIDLSHFRLWYSQAGTPKVTAALEHEPGGGRATLRLAQQVPPTPGQPNKQPMPIPLRIALFGERSGEKIEEQLAVLVARRRSSTSTASASGRCCRSTAASPRPVIVETDRTGADLAFLSAHDDDPVARYEAMQQLMLGTLVDAVSGREADQDAVVEAVRETLANQALDPAFVAEAVLLPSEAFIGDHMLVSIPTRSARPRHAAAAPRRGAGGAVAGRLCRQCRQSLRIFAGGQRRPAAAHGIPGLCDGRRGCGRAGPCDAAVRRRRQHDRPAGGAGHPGQLRCAGAAGGPSRLLRSLSRQRAGARQMVHRPGLVLARRHGRRSGAACRPPGLLPLQP
jgi:aminopeptidase N